MKLLKTLFDRFKPKQKDIHMDHFSIEYRDKLVAEHRLVVAMLERATEKYLYYRQRTTVPVIEGVMFDLKTQKFQLELRIDVLTEFLES